MIEHFLAENIFSKTPILFPQNFMHDINESRNIVQMRL